MKFTVSRFPLLLILVLSVFVATATAQQDQSIVQGRVVYADNGQPMKGVRVTAVNPRESDAERVAVTNDRGEFLFSGLPAGKYYVTIQGRKAPLPSGLAVRIPLPVNAIPRAEEYEEIAPKHDAEFTVDGKSSTSIEIRFVRGGSVTGKVMKSNGTPVSDASVSLVSSPGAGSNYGERFSARTDKNGNFRVEHVPPAKYVVSAAVESQQANNDIYARLRGESQSVTYHPAALKLVDALPVVVESGRESSGINITLVERKAFGVSGTVVQGGDGSVLSNVDVVLRRKDIEMAGPEMPGQYQRRTRTNNQGEFSFPNVEEGAYEVTALYSASGPMSGGARQPLPGRTPGTPRLGPMQVGPRPRFVMAQQLVDVLGTKVENLTLVINSPGTVRGSVEMDGGQTVPADLLLFFETTGITSRPGRPEPVRVEPDGTFVLPDVQSSGQLFLNPALPPDSPYFVSSATLSGTDLSSGINVVAGAETGPLVIRLSDKFAAVSGQVSTSANGVRTGLVVLFIPANTAKQRFRTAFYSTRTTDGSYTIKVAPGEYFVVARMRDALPPVITPEFMQSLPADTPRVIVGPGEQKTLDLGLPR